jgi:outer membrane protein TolC
MSGPFYGSLAASASVFVAILTALLVNNYVEIKSQRRQTETELERVKEELKRFKKQRDNHKETIDELTGRREKRFKQNARERVSDFIENQVPSQISQPMAVLNRHTAQVFTVSRLA